MPSVIPDAALRCMSFSCVAFEPPSAAFTLDWRLISGLPSRGVAFATITHAAGILSTGDDELDKRMPFDEPYRIPQTTAAAIRRVRTRGGRVVAVGATVVRALEHAATCDGTVQPAEGLATWRIRATTDVRVVDSIISGIHEPGTSHYELLRAFTDDVTLGRACAQMTARDYRTHEFGDSVLIERSTRAVPARLGMTAG
jgi:S-adenosylmethionine:tRNA ribosyltransferase-isomerase